MEVEYFQNPPQSNVQVAIRVRPLNQKECKENEEICLETTERQVTLLQNSRLFKFDFVFDQYANQEQIYRKYQISAIERCVSTLVSRCFEGYNSTILAYGQTGSGKTHTMGTTGVILNSEKTPDQGMIPRVIFQIFNEVERMKEQEIFIYCSYLELYNEQIIDLLSDSSNLPTIREEKDHTITILNLTKTLVNNTNEMFQVLNRGASHRTTAATQMNMTSSRSHAIFTIYFEINPNDEDGALNAKFHFVDLAGSERLKKTLAQGKTMEEGININQSLLVLGNVIKTLSDQKKKNQTHIPYRESKLTRYFQLKNRILQDSLGGNSNTCMIACVSPAESNYEETLNTLKYASRAREIQNKPTQNRDPHAAQILQLKQELSALLESNKYLKKLLDKNGIWYDEVQRYSVASVQQYQSNTQCNHHADIIAEQKLALAQWEIQGKSHRTEMIKIQSYVHDLELELLNVKKNKDILNRQFQESVRYHNYLIRIQKSFGVPLGNVDCSQIEELYQDTQKQKRELIQNEEKISKMEKQIDELIQVVISFIQEQEAHRDQKILCQKQRELMYYQKKCDKLENPEAYSQQNDLEEEIELNDAMIKETNLQIEEFESNLEEMTWKNTQLKMQLAEDMKTEFQTQISILESQKASLMKQVLSKQDSSCQLKNKLQEYEQKIQDMKWKQQNMKHMEKRLEVQESQVRDLQTNIEKMKKQKVELVKKMKQENEKFIKEKEEQQKLLILLKKQKIQQDAAVFKLKNDNCKKDVLLRRKDDEILKQRNERVFEKQSTNSRRSLKQQEYDSMEKQIDVLFNQLVEGGWADQQITQEIAKLEQLQEEVNQIETKICQLQIKKEQKSFDQLQKEIVNQIELELSDIIIVRENINETIDYQLHKIEQLRRTSNSCNETYNSFLMNSDVKDLPNWATRILKYIIDSWIKDHLQMQSQTQQIEDQQTQINDLQIQLSKPLQEISCNSPHIKKKIVKTTITQNQPADTLELRKQLNDQKRKYQYLQNENKLMLSDLDYYKKFYTEHINKIQKDKCIGLNEQAQLPQGQSFHQIREAYKQERTKQKELSLNLSLQKLNGQNSALRVAKTCKSERESFIEQFSQANDDQEFKYDLVKQIPGHENPILCVYTLQNLLCSSSFRSVKIWDMQAQQLVGSMDSNSHVRSICHWPQRKAFAVSHGNSIFLYDSTTLEFQTSFKSSIDEIRVMTSHNGLLVAGGKGINSALNVWDTRSNNVLFEMEKSSDILCLSSCDTNQEIIWGTFNHNVRKMTLNNQKYGAIAQMSPPHYDKVTGVGMLENWIVSCSFGKAMRLWNQVTGQQGQANTDIHKDSILSMAVDRNLNILYTGCKDGQIKVSRVNDNKFSLVSDISASVQQINSLHIINDNSFLVSGGQDRVIKIWKPSKYTQDHLKQFVTDVGDFLLEEEQFDQ